MPEIGSMIPWRWLKDGKEAVRLAILALSKVNARIDEMNPLEDMEEMAYARKAREALQKAIRETAFMENIQP